MISVKTLTNLKVVYKLGRRMTNDLPLKLDPVLYANQGRSIAGQISTHDLPRIADSASKTNKNLDVTMSFSTSSLKFPLVQGTIVGSIVQTCQRCLQDTTIKLDEEFALLLVNPELIDEASKEGYEIFEYSGQFISTVELIEDEVLLAMPIVPKHKTVEECDPDARKWLTDVETLPEGGKQNPFADLKKLKIQ